MRERQFADKNESVDEENWGGRLWPVPTAAVLVAEITRNHRLCTPFLLLIFCDRWKPSKGSLAEFHFQVNQM